MYQKTEEQIRFEDLHLLFSGHLDHKNSWVLLAQLIPWDILEGKYAARFCSRRMGAPAKPVRMALGALIIKERCGYSDEETVARIRENPYLNTSSDCPNFKSKLRLTHH